VSEYLIVRLSEKAPEATWIALGSDGHRLAQLRTGPLSDVAIDAQGRRIILLVDGLSITTTSANLPVKSSARLLKMLPFSLEDSVADDVDKFHFCPGPRDSDGTVSVAIVERDRIDGWLADCDKAGLRVNSVYADTEGVPDTPGNLTIVLEGNRLYARAPGRPPFVFESLSLLDVLEILKSVEDDDAGNRHVVIYADEAGFAGRETEIESVREHALSVDVQLLPEGPLPRFGATLIARPGSNLLQGSYAPKSNWNVLIRPWRAAAVLLLSLALIATLAEGVRYFVLSQQDQALTTELESRCQTVFQIPDIAACRSEIQRRLAAVGDTSSATSGPIFLATLLAVAEARDPSSRLEALSYRNGATDMRVVARDVPTLDEFSREVSSSGRFQVNIVSANPGNEGIEGRLQVVEAVP
jgi:general secretion pathway protein L